MGYTSVSFPLVYWRVPLIECDEGDFAYNNA